MSIVIEKAFQARLKAGEPVRERLEEMTKDPMKAQREFLTKLLDDNKSSGTVGIPKKIPMTVRGRDLFMGCDIQ